MKEIKLSQGRIAFVSDEDFERVSRFKWTAHKGSQGGERWYAVRNAVVKVEIAPGVLKSKRKWVRLHRFVMDDPAGTLSDEMVVDHLDGNGFNCVRENLEVVTLAENSRRAGRKNVECFL